MSTTPAPSIPVVVVSPSADERVSELKESLLRIGYPVRVCLQSEELVNVAPSEVVVCFLAELPSSRVSHQRYLKLLKSHAVLGVVTSDAASDCQPLLVNCADFCAWPTDPGELEIRIGRIAAQPSRKKNPRVQRDYDDNPLNKLVGRSPGFVNSIRQIHRVAPYDAPVLVTGETGTGKEIVARAVHYQGPRRDGPFIPVNCGALPENLIENELFGHERGAYTDASKRSKGLLSQADGGTLFLDELDALPIKKGQTALLRVLEDQEYRPLGGAEAQTVDVRIIVATNARLRSLVEEGAFRADLYYRLNILRIALPPLRDRGADIELLTEHFLSGFAAQYGVEKQISPDGLRSLMSHNWPGNVRELQNFLHREFLQEDDTVLECGSLAEFPSACDIPPPMLPEVDEQACFQDAKAKAVARFEREYLVRVIRKTRGNVSEAARLAGKERRAMGRLLQKHDIDAASYR